MAHKTDLAIRMKQTKNTCAFKVTYTTPWNIKPAKEQNSAEEMPQKNYGTLALKSCHCILKSKKHQTIIHLINIALVQIPCLHTQWQYHIFQLHTLKLLNSLKKKKISGNRESHGHATHFASIHTIPDPWPWINSCLEQWSEQVLLFNWVTFPFN